MKIESAFLANHAEVRDSVVFASGAFPEWWVMPELGLTLPVGLCVVFSLDMADLDRTFNWQVELLRPNGDVESVAAVNTVRRASEALDRGPDWPIYQSVASIVGLRFLAEGRHEVIVRGGDRATNGDVRAAIPIAARLTPPQTA